MDAIPLSTDTVIRQVVEHVVEPVATQHTVFRYQSSCHADTCSIMEIERGVTNGEHPTLFYRDAFAIDYHWTDGLDDGVVYYHEVVQCHCIPAIGTQVHALCDSTLKGKHQLVFYQLRVNSISLTRCYLYEDTQTVTLSHLQTSGHRVEEGTIDIGTESRLVATLQSNTVDTQSVASTVVNPEGIGGRWNSTEECIELQGIDTESQLRTGIGRKRVIIAACSKQGSY